MNTRSSFVRITCTVILVVALLTSSVVLLTGNGDNVEAAYNETRPDTTSYTNVSVSSESDFGTVIAASSDTPAHHKMTGNKIYKLTNDVVVTSQIRLYANQSAVLDLNGYTITCNFAAQGLWMADKSTLVIQDSKGSGHDGVFQHGTYKVLGDGTVVSYVANGTTATVNDGKISVSNATVGTVSGGSISIPGAVNGTVVTYVADGTTGTATVSGGSISIPGAADGTVVSYIVDGNTTTVSGGKITVTGVKAVTYIANGTFGIATNSKGEIPIPGAVNGTAVTYVNHFMGTGIVCSYATLFFDSGIVENNSGDGTGGGLYVRQKDYTVDGVSVSFGYLEIGSGTIIRNNTATSDGAGIYSRGKTVINDGVVIEGNTSGGNGGGIHVNSGLITINEVTISSNTAKTNGGAIDAKVEFSFNNCTFNNNKASGLGGAINTTRNVILTNCTMNGNSSSSNGGAVYAGGTVSASSSTFISNSAKCGGALYSGGNSVTIKTCTFESNTSTSTTTGGGGGAIYSAGNVTVDGGTYTANTAKADGGAIYATGTLSVQCTTSATVSFTGNTASNGGAVSIAGGTISSCVFKENSATTNGGAIYNTGTLSVSDSEFSENKGQYGGAIQSGKSTSLTVDNVVFNQNESTQHGGAVYSLQSTILSDVTFTGNTATSNGGALYHQGTLSFTGDATFRGNKSATGGAIYSDGSATFAKCIFESNTATSNGGAIYSASTGSMTVTDTCMLRQNTTTSNGGAINAQGPLTITGGSFESNHANNGGAIYSNNIISVTGSSSFSKNTATNGGAIYSAATNTATLTYTTTDGATKTHTATFLMGGNTVIDNNTAVNCGGGVYVRGAMYIASGTISNNQANTGTNGGKQGGGGVYGEKITSSFTMDDGRITGNVVDMNKKNSEGGGVCCYGKFALDGGEVDHNEAFDGGGVWAGIWVIGEFARIHDNTAVLGGGMYVNEKYEYGKDENGNPLYKLGSGTMYGGSVYDNKATSAGGGIFVHGYAYIYGGSISANTAGWAGGGIMTWPNGGGEVSGSIIIMYGGSIDNNVILCEGETMYSVSLGYYGGGGVYVLDRFTIYDGTISNNEILKFKELKIITEDSKDYYIVDSTQEGASSGGKSIPVLGSAISINKNGLVTIYDGTLTGNTGGEVTIYNLGTLKVVDLIMDGGLICLENNAWAYFAKLDSLVGDVITANTIDSVSKAITRYTPRITDSITYYRMDLHHYIVKSSENPNWTSSVIFPTTKSTTTKIGDMIDYGCTIPVKDEMTWYLNRDHWTEETIPETDKVDTEAYVSTLSRTDRTCHIYTYGHNELNVYFEIGDAVGTPPENTSYASETPSWIISLPTNLDDEGNIMFGGGRYNLTYDEDYHIVIEFDPSTFVFAGWKIKGYVGNTYLKPETPYTVTCNASGDFILYVEGVEFNLGKSPVATFVPYILPYYIFYVLGTGTIEERTYNQEDVIIQILPDLVPTREGYIFNGWSYVRSGVTTHYAQGGIITDFEKGKIYLFAEWVKAVHTADITIDINDATHG